MGYRLYGQKKNNSVFEEDTKTITNGIENNNVEGFWEFVYTTKNEEILSSLIWKNIRDLDVFITTKKHVNEHISVVWKIFEFRSDMILFLIEQNDRGNREEKVLLIAQGLVYDGIL